MIAKISTVIVMIALIITLCFWVYGVTHLMLDVFASIASGIAIIGGLIGNFVYYFDNYIKK